jgi:alcohol dehydrogenase (cytochrome c)
MLFKKDGKDLIVHMNKSGCVRAGQNTATSTTSGRATTNINFVKEIDKKTGDVKGRVELPMNQETLICPSTFGANVAGIRAPITRNRSLVQQHA